MDFFLGITVFDYTEAIINFIFSVIGVSHCTGVPYNVLDVPNVLKGKKAYGTVVNQELAVKDFLKKSVIVWSGFGRVSAAWRISLMVENLWSSFPLEVPPGFAGDEH